MASRQEGYRDHEWTSTYGGVEQRWLLMDSEPCRRKRCWKAIKARCMRNADADF
jgi:hypothetical protein